MKPRHLLLACALAVAAALAMFGDHNADSGIAEPTARPTPSRSASSSPRHNVEHASAADVIAVQARAALYPEAIPGKSPGLFAGHNWQPATTAIKAGPKPPPSAPPLPFVYLGKKIEDGLWEIYLGRGDESLVVREKTVIDGTWRIDAINPPTMTLTYLPLKQAQSFIIGGTD